MQGKIYQILAGYYDIKSNNQFYRVRAAGKLRYLEQTPLVGDEIIFTDFVEKILPRRNFLIRPKIANVDQVLIIMSLAEPNFSTYLLDKFLAVAYLSQITPIIIFTKRDLNNNLDLNFYYDNHVCYETSLSDQTIIQKLASLFAHKVTVLMGQSGVGKTTLLNKLTNSNYSTQAISKALGRGKHTTRVVMMMDFLDGQIVDTPGFGSLSITDSTIDLAYNFQFYKNYQHNCKHRSCIHLDERADLCGVKQDLLNNKLPQWRYDNYHKIISEIKYNL